MVSLLDNGSCFRKVAPNTRSSEKSRFTWRDHVSGCMSTAAPGGQMGPFCTLRRRVMTSWVLPQSAIRHPAHREAAPICAGVARPLSVAPTVSPHVSQRYGCVRGSSGAAMVARHMPVRARHARVACMYEPIPTSSGWIAAVAQKLWSPGSSGPRRSPMLGAASRGPRGPRGY
jgi:hypothetical protein